MSELFTRLLEARGFGADFLTPKYEDLADPFLLIDMQKAVKRIKKAAEAHEKVLIYGDYDVDGVTASTVMHDALVMAGVQDIEVMLPDRFLDGYGMSKKVVNRAKRKKCSLVVTVDCGSSNNEIIDEFNASGIDVIVTDHHECSSELPKALAIINPKRKDMNDGNLRNLAGVGVAFKVTQALVKEGIIEAGREKWLLDIVMIGTVCDSMRMCGDNRILCYYGMLVLKKTRRVGLKELIKIGKINLNSSDAIGFQIGPRLNAAGRMETAEKALKLLMTKDRPEAAKIAYELEKLNKLRREWQKKAIDEVSERGVGDSPVIVETGDWHEGVLGIIAGRLVEKYKRPAFVLTEVDGVLKGSGRSFGEFSLAEALSECQNYIVSGGGHAGACGVKVLMDKIEDFTNSVNDYYRSLKLVDQERFLDTTEDLMVSEMGGFTLEFLDELHKLEPYGLGNAEPVFCLNNVMVLSSMDMGAEKQHLRLTVRGKDGKNIKLVAFSAPEEWKGVEGGTRADIWVNAVSNEWNGLTSVEGRIIKMCLKSEY